jgi:hypothetical protein
MHKATIVGSQMHMEMGGGREDWHENIIRNKGWQSDSGGAVQLLFKIVPGAGNQCLNFHSSWTPSHYTVRNGHVEYFFS